MLDAHKILPQKPKTKIHIRVSSVDKFPYGAYVEIA
jgi:hypothetical protein